METKAEIASDSPKKPLRSGWTTGSCAAAAAKAAALALLGRNEGGPLQVEIPLPKNRGRAKLRVERIERSESNGSVAMTATVIKDAGDDPDCTHGAEICATASFLSPSSEMIHSPDPLRKFPFIDRNGVRIVGGPGVGRITRPGLGLPVGGPDITEGPQWQIEHAVKEALQEILEKFPSSWMGSGGKVQVMISVPKGEELAKKTLLRRLGVEGGIGILGTKGIVEPYSTAAWRASVEQGIDVAAAMGCKRIVVSTGGSSEELAKKKFPDDPEVAFVEMGDFIGHSLRRAHERGIQEVVVAGYLGKLSKIASGRMQTHAAGSKVDSHFLAGIALAAGASPALAEKMRAEPTARRIGEMAREAGLTQFFREIADRTVAACQGHLREKFGESPVRVRCVLFDFDGTVLAESPDGRPPSC